MRVIFVVLLSILALLPAEARNLAIIGGGVPAAPASYAYTQDFNATTEPNPPTDWVVVTGDPNWDEATTGLDMEGAQCVSAAAGVDFRWTPASIATEFYVTVKLRLNEAIESGELVMLISTGGGTTLGQIQWQTNGAMRAQATGGTQSASTSETITAGNSNYIKVYFKQGTGANDTTIEVWVWTGSAWGTKVSSTNGTNATAPARVYLRNVSDTEIMYFDYFIYHTADITSPVP